jgi:hypothetical protein
MSRMPDSYHALLELSRPIRDAMHQPLDANSSPNANRNKDSNHCCCKGWSDHLFIHKKMLSSLIKTSQLLCTMTCWRPLIRH